MKRLLRAAIAPVLFLTLTVYFGYNAIHGSRGFIAQAAEDRDIVNARHDLKAVLAKRDFWEARVAALKPAAIQPDMLDQQARTVLNLANPADLVVPLHPAAPAPDAPAK